MAGVPPPSYYQLPVPAPAPVAQSVPTPVVVVGPQFVAPYPVELVATKKLMTPKAGQFTVTDANQNIMFTIRGSFWSLHDNRVLLDAAGHPLLTLRQKILTMHSRWRVYRGESKEPNDVMMTVKRSTVFQLKSTLDVFLAGNTAEEVPDFRVIGGYCETGCTVYLGNTSIVLAQMHRQDNTLQSVFLDKDTYAFTVSPNVDYAFIVALILLLHEISTGSIGQEFLSAPY